MPNKKKFPASSSKNPFADVAAFFVLAVFCIHPLAISPKAYLNITVTKLYTYLAIVAITAVLFIATAIYHRKDFIRSSNQGKKPSFLKKIRPYEVVLLICWVGMLISALLSDYRKEAFLGASKRSEGFLMMTVYFLSVVFIGRFYRIKESHLFAFCAVASLVSLYGIFQYYGMDFLHFNPAQLANVQGPDLVYVSTMSNRNVLSTYLCLAFSFCAVLFSHSSGKKEQWAYLVMGWIIFYMLLLGQTEGGYIGILGSLALLFPILFSTPLQAGRFLFMMSGCSFFIWVSVQVHFDTWPSSVWAPVAPWFLFLSLLLTTIGAFFMKSKNLPPFPARYYRIIWYSLVLFSVILVIFLIPSIAEISNHKAVQAANEILKGNFDDRLGSDRMFIWKRTLRMIPEKLLFGHGPDTFFPSFMNRFGVESITKNFIRYDKVHNEYLQILFDNGLVGLSSQLLFWGIILKSLIKRHQNTLCCSLLLALSCFLVQAIFSFSTPFAHPLVWALWGLGASSFYSSNNISH